MRTLIVGCGYVGIPLGTELVRQGHEVFGLRRSSAAKAELEAAGIRLLTGDITRPADLAALPGPFDWVVNTAASTQGGEEDYRHVYLEGTRNLVHWLSAQPPKKYVYTSSTSVYGQKDGSIVKENAPTDPSSATGKVLVKTERFLLEAAAKQQFPAVILRVAGIYGPGRGYWLNQFLRGEARIPGHGERITNMIHVDDLVGILIAALQRGKPGEVYNAVDDEPVNLLHLCHWLADTLGKPMPPYMPEDEAEQRRRGVSSKKVLNRKLKMELGCRLRYPTFRDGLTAEIARMEAAGLIEPTRDTAP